MEENGKTREELVQELEGLRRRMAALERTEHERHRAAEEFIEKTFEGMGEGLIVIDRDFRIISANDAYVRRAGVPRERIIGRHCHAVTHHMNVPCYQAGMDCAAKHTFETGGPHTFSHAHSDHDGNISYVETKTYPIRDASGGVVSVIGIVNDVTEKRKLEEQLRHAQKMEAIGQLTGGVAHDFNNILTAIIGYANLLKLKMREEDPLRHNADQILALSERAATLTQRLLAFGRKQILNPVPVDLNEIIRGVEKLLMRLMGEDIEIKTNLSESGPTVIADDGQIEQVLMNLATNARDAMPDGGEFLIETGCAVFDEEYARTHGYGEPGIYALISVTDTGLGMDEETKGRIFEPFFTTKEAGKGTGLGLAAVYGIVKQHNGYINVYSEVGKGTAFKISLPAIEAKARAPRSAQRAETMEGTEAVLVAEDDENVREITRTVLSEFGYKVIEAVDGDDAIEKFKEHREEVKLLLLDVIMPKKDGREVYEEVRKIRPDIKTLFTSGYTANIIHKKGILESDLEFVIKPISPRELLRKVREILDKGR